MKKLLVILLGLVLILSFATACAPQQSESAQDDAVAEDDQADAETPDTEDAAEDDDTGDDAGDDEIVIAGIYKMGDLEWFQDEAAAAGQTAKELGAKDFNYIDVKTDPDLFLQALDNVIVQKVDGVLVCIPDQQLSKVAVQKLTDAGIPFIACDDKLEDENGVSLSPWVGISAYEIGKATMEWMVDYMIENGLDTDPEVGIMFLTADSISSCVPRTQAQRDVLADRLPDFPEERVFSGDHGGDTESGFNAASAIITGNPEIKKWMIMGIHDDGIVGGVRALEQAGLDKESCAVGLGGHLAPPEFEKEYSALKAAAYFSAYDVGSTSATYLMDYILNGTEIPMEYAVGAVMVTPDNYKDIMQEYID